MATILFRSYRSRTNRLTASERRSLSGAQPPGTITASKSSAVTSAASQSMEAVSPPLLLRTTRPAFVPTTVTAAPPSSMRISGTQNSRSSKPSSTRMAIRFPDSVIDSSRSGRIGRQQAAPEGSDDLGHVPQVVFGQDGDPVDKGDGAEERVARPALPLGSREIAQGGGDRLAGGDETLNRRRTFLVDVIALSDPVVGVDGGEERIVLLQKDLQARQVYLAIDVAQKADDLERGEGF